MVGKGIPVDIPDSSKEMRSGYLAVFVAGTRMSRKIKLFRKDTGLSLQLELDISISFILS
jgi:hypothetical protein